MHLRVAGFTIHVTSSRRDVNLTPGTASRPFLLIDAPEPAAADVTIDVTAGTVPTGDDDGGGDGARDCLFDSGGPWRLYRHDDGFLFRFFSSAFGPSPYKTALFDPGFSRGVIRFNPAFVARATTIDPLEYPLDELLVISLLGQGRGIEIHGCGVVDPVVDPVVDEEAAGYLFVGQSGAGKSTMARVWLEAYPDAVILSDDRVVLRADGEGVWMYGTPWHGEEPLASPRRALLRRLFFLRQHTSNDVTPVPAVASVARLLAASFPPFHDPAAIAFTLEFLRAVVERVAPVELGFVPNRAVINLIRDSTRR